VNLSGPAPGACVAGSRSPWSLSLAPPAPQRIAPLCSSASQLLRQSQTSRARASSVTASRLSDADLRVHPQAKPETSRFPNKELPHMPGSPTTPGRADTRVVASVHVAFRDYEHVGTRVAQVFAGE
jgi:hypothetical protein